MLRLCMTLALRARLVLGALLLSLSVLPAAAATRIDLNDGWQFRTDAKDEGVAAGWPQRPPAPTRAVTLPHTWAVGCACRAELRRRLLPQPRVAQRRGRG